MSLRQVLAARNTGVQLLSANDFRTYRVSVTRRLAKQRRDLGVAARTASGSKTLSRPTASLSDQRLVSLYVLMCEAAWAHAMETKAVLDSTGQGTRAARTHVISKLAKALKYSRELVAVAKTAGASTAQLLELYAYQSLLEGSLRFEQRQWASARQVYSVARVLVQAIMRLGDDDGNSADSSSLKEVLTVTVDPSLAYADLRLQSGRTTDIPTLAQTLALQAAHPAVELVQANPATKEVVEVDADGSSPAERLGGLVWRTHEAQIRDPDLASAILTARAREAELDGQKVVTASDFDGPLLAWQDALDRVKTLLETHDDDSQDYFIASTYISYHMILRRIQRDVLIAESLKGSGGRVYDTIVQSVAELAELPGVHNDDDLAESLKILGNYFRAQQAQLLADAYLSNHRVAEALALKARAHELVSSGRKLAVEFAVLTQAQLDQAVEQSAVELARVHGLAALKALDTARPAGQEPVVDAVHKFPLGTPAEVCANLVDFNPRLEPVAVKPVYFDIAFNYIDYESQTLTQTQTETETSGTPKKGFLGLWGR